MCRLPAGDEIGRSADGLGVPYSAVSLNVSQAIARHLHPPPPPVNGIQYQSSFYALLREARWAADRNVDTGVLDAKSDSSRWLGAAAYLMLLDQIGKSFKPVGPEVGAGNDVVRACKSFTAVPEPEAMALYALRNAFAHSYGLFNPNNSVDALRHAFNLSTQMNDPLVRLPTTTWSGDFNQAVPPSEVTRVNIRKLGDMVEDLVARLRGDHALGTLDIRMPVQQFMTQYGMLYTA